MHLKNNKSNQTLNKEIKVNLISLKKSTRPKAGPLQKDRSQPELQQKSENKLDSQHKIRRESESNSTRSKIVEVNQTQTRPAAKSKSKLDPKTIAQ